MTVEEVKKSRRPSLGFAVQPFSLQFVDEFYENEYSETSAFTSFHAHLTGSILLMLLFLTGYVVIDMLAYTDDIPSDWYLALSFACAAIGFVLMLLSYCGADDPFAQTALLIRTAIMTLACTSFAVSTVVKSDDLLRYSSSGGTVVFLGLSHLTGTLLYFPHILTSCLCTLIAFITTIVISKADEEQDERMILHIFVVSMGCVCILYNAYRSDRSAREKFYDKYKAQLASAEKYSYKKEAQNLREEVFAMTLEKYNIADFDPDEQQIQFQAPIEQAMAKLQAIVKDPTLSRNNFEALNTVITLLGSDDVFQVKVEEALHEAGVKIDNETETWLLNMVHGDLGQGAARTTSEEDSSSLIFTPVPTESNRSVSQPVLSKEEKAFQQILGNFDEWDFDIFEISNLSKGKPLFVIGMALFRKYDLIQKFNISSEKLKNFMSAIESTYQDAPYHNSTHGADVARSVSYFVIHGKMDDNLSSLEILALLTASLCHDVDHPGRTNAYHIATRDSKAILYNDKSILENHHAATTFSLLTKDEFNIFENISGKEFNDLRKIMIEVILNTDLGAHFDFCAKFNKAVGNLDRDSDAGKLMMMKMALKCGDLGHSAKNLELHKKWTGRITEEFYRQGDDERKRKIPISPFMDRQNADLPKSQIGFLDFLVIPMFKSWAEFLDVPSISKCVEQVTANRNHWKALADANAGGGINAKEEDTKSREKDSPKPEKTEDNAVGKDLVVNTNAEIESNERVENNASETLPTPSSCASIGSPKSNEEPDIASNLAKVEELLEAVDLDSA